MNNIASIGHMFNALNHTIVQLNMEMENIKRDMATLRPQSVTDANESTHVDAHLALEELRKELSTKVSKTEIEAIRTSVESLTTEIAKLAMVTSLFPRVSALETKEAERSLQSSWVKQEDVQRMIAEYLNISIPQEIPLDAETFKVDIPLPSTTDTSSVPQQIPELTSEIVEQITAVEESEPLSKVAAKATKGTRGRGRGSKKTLTV